ncbi:hypothetical protein GIB67_014288, partial [Kingdonia uniflora]
VGKHPYAHNNITNPSRRANAKKKIVQDFSEQEFRNGQKRCGKDGMDGLNPKP